MIRKQLVFKPSNDYKLNYNYQHAVQGIIYNLLDHSNKRLAHKLHSKGYVYKDKRIFKLFNYTLLFTNVSFKETIEISTDSTVKIIITGKEEIIENIIAAIVDLRMVKLFDLELKLTGLENDKEFKFQETMLYDTLSPVSISVYDNGIRYLDIYEEEYFRVLGKNLIKKYELIYNEEFKDELYFDLDDFLSVRDKSIKIKDGFIRGKEYKIWIETSKKMQKVAYFLGIGNKSSIGLGCLNYVTGSDLNE